MTTSSCGRRAWRVTAAASVLTVSAVVGAAILALGVGVSEAWWPHTGQAFAAGARTAHHDPCALIVGPATAYCERGATTTAAGRHKVAGAAWRLVPAGAGVASLVLWRRWRAAGQRRG
ncbi:hypothetical protein AB0478_45790 [Streptomyces sp. NPDC051917]|uniref:hypothetical protein n=1 Tax=Streptomyces sp. NPDC051917 TaxID=3154754 RepID=UPI0034540C27